MLTKPATRICNGIELVHCIENRSGTEPKIITIDISTARDSFDNGPVCEKCMRCRPEESPSIRAMFDFDRIPKQKKESSGA